MYAVTLPTCVNNCNLLDWNYRCICYHSRISTRQSLRFTSLGTTTVAFATLHSLDRTTACDRIRTQLQTLLYVGAFLLTHNRLSMSLSTRYVQCMGASMRPLQSCKLHYAHTRQSEGADSQEPTEQPKRRNVSERLSHDTHEHRAETTSRKKEGS